MTVPLRRRTDVDSTGLPPLRALVAEDDGNYAAYIAALLRRFGFDVTVTSNGTAALAFMNTQVATAAAVLGWIAVEKVRDGHPTSLGGASGAVAGLVAITPACAFIAPWRPSPRR